MLDAPVAFEIEDRILAEDGGIEIAVRNDELVALGCCLADDLAVGIDDETAADQRMTVLVASLGDRDHPGRVLIGARLHCQAIVEQALLRAFVGFLRIDATGVL